MEFLAITGKTLGQTLMRPMLVEIIGIPFQDSAQLPFTDDQQVV